jgi:hypothetical protein
VSCCHLITKLTQENGIIPGFINVCRKISNVNHCIKTNTVDERRRELDGGSVDQHDPCVCKTEDSLPSSQEAATDLSERGTSGRILIIDIAATVFVFLIVVVVVVVVGVDGFPETDTTAALSKVTRF